MTFNSTNLWMKDAAKEIPDGVNTVAFIRHAERYTNPPDGDYSNLMLTPNGIKMANDIGSSIDRKIGIMRSSPVGRCMQTVQEIIKCVPDNFKPDNDISNDKEKLTSHSFCHIQGDPRPKEQGGVGWYEYFHFLQIHDTQGSRGITLEQETKTILDAIFSQTLDSKQRPAQTEKGMLDIICTHDSHIVIMASALFGLKTQTDWSEEWCKWAEGLFFFGTRNNFTAFWRGQKKEFSNYLMQI